MKIFILEDDARRISQFKDKLWKDGRVIYVAKSVAEAIEMVTKEGPFDTVFLDHDLAPQHYLALKDECDPNEPRVPDGHDFVLWMVENGGKVVHDYTQVFIHSMNPVGVQNMLNTINSSVLDVVPTAIPFGRLINAIQ